jgi:hypothetical protein
MAFAVTAMSGKREKRFMARICRMTSYPSSSGIMMSFSTISMSGVVCSRRMASLPVSAG